MGFDAGIRGGGRRRRPGRPFVPNPDKFEGMGAHDALVETSGALNVVAVSLLKIANDIRLLSSGPRCGLNELVLPHDGLSSSIMPGKRNATLAEASGSGLPSRSWVGMPTISLAGSAGHFELNVAKPVLIHNLLRSIRLLAYASRAFAGKLVDGLDVDRAQLATNVENALLLATALNPVLGLTASRGSPQKRTRIGPRLAKPLSHSASSARGSTTASSMRKPCSGRKPRNRRFD